MGIIIKIKKCHEEAEDPEADEVQVGVAVDSLEAVEEEPNLHPEVECSEDQLLQAHQQEVPAVGVLKLLQGQHQHQHPRQLLSSQLQLHHFLVEVWVQDLWAQWLLVWLSVQVLRSLIKECAQ